MTHQLSDHYMSVARRVIQDMFAVKKGEVVALTEDDATDPLITQAFFQAAAEVEAKPMLIKVRQSSKSSEAGMSEWPAAALEAAFKHVDVWIENGGSVFLYSSMWERVLEENPSIRYNVLGGATLESIERVFCHYDIDRMKRVIDGIVAKIETAKVVRVKGASGTDLTYETDPRHVIDNDCGDFSSKTFGTAPGYVNIVPKTGTMNGRIVFDMVEHTDLSRGGRAELVMRDGKIVDYLGDKVGPIRDFVEGFDEENMRKISHMMIGLCPGAQELSWEIVEDERIWGGVDFGFGHTSVLDMPPNGQTASSHFDGISTKASVWLDDELIVENGVFVHPDIKEDAEQLLAGYQKAVSG